ncbi:MAG: VWA domain-containing protein [Myxococcales bacterium]|nr:VWA domain-containing protein [Myxococcales bacterium]
MESPTPSRARVMLVLDKSGSMGVDSWDHDQNANTATVTRWSVLRNVLGAVLPAHDDALELGAQLYPSKAATSDYSSAACPVAAPEVPVDSHNAASVLAAIPVANDVTIKGGQPTATALRSATDELLAQGGSSPRYIVLVADGAANCMAGAPDTTSLFEDYDTDAIDAALDAYAAGIPTFVLGVNASVFPAGNVKDGNPDGVAASDTLAELADAGGTDYVNAYTQTELQSAYDGFLEASRY